MKSGWRMVIAAAAALQGLGGAAFAQNAVTPAPATNATDVGPAQLRDFTLNGTVTREAEPREQPPAPAARSPATQPPRAAPSSTTALPPARSPSATVAAPAPTTRSSTVELAPPSTAPELQPDSEAFPVGPDSQDEAAATFPPEPATMPQGSSLLPWLLAAMVIGAGAAYYVFRVRPRAQLATAGEVAEFAAPEPEPDTPKPPAPAPRAAVPGGGGIVSTSLRPWIEIDVQPERTIVDDETIAIELVVALYNSGSAPARDVLVETAMFNASPAQDQQITGFFARPAGRGERVEVVAPLQRVTVRTVVKVPRAEVRPLHAQGRPLLVPMTALTAIYRWGSNKTGQSSASYLVGKQTSGDKLAPFRLDIGPRVFRGLAAREHQLRVRN